MDEKALALGLINKYFSWYSYDTEGLGKEMAAQVSYNPGVINQVFVQLQENGYDGTTIIKTARSFLDKTAVAILSEVGKSPDGSILLTMVHRILKCDAADNQTAARCVKIETAFAQTTGKAQTQVVAQSNETNEPRQLSQSEMDWYANYNQTNLIFYERNGKGVLRSTGGERNNFNSDICWQLPVSGIGFVIYNRNDLKTVSVLKDNQGLDQIGKKETVDAIIRLAQEWNVVHSDRKLQIGDMSRPGGINTPDHHGHDSGKIVDIRPLRNDSSIGDEARLNYNSAGYDRELTKEFIRLAFKLFPGAIIRFNDPEMQKVQEFRGKILKDSNNGKTHNDHLHLEFP